MKPFWLIWLLVFWVVALSAQVSADIVDAERPTFDFTSNGNREYHHWTATAKLPIGFINGGIDADWLHAHSAGETATNHLEFTLDGGYHFKRVGLRAYTRYGRKSVMQQDSHWQGGVYLHVDVVEHKDFEIDTALLLWADQERLLEFYQPTETEADDISFGPGVHLNFRYKRLKLNTEFLLDNGFEKYRIIATPEFEIPLFKILFLEPISLVLTGDVEYRRMSRHVDIKNFQWHGGHRLRWKF